VRSAVVRCCEETVLAADAGNGDTWASACGGGGAALRAERTKMTRNDRTPGMQVRSSKKRQHTHSSRAGLSCAAQCILYGALTEPYAILDVFQPLRDVTSSETWLHLMAVWCVHEKAAMSSAWRL
jgi:hypothetical protein